MVRFVEVVLAGTHPDGEKRLACFMLHSLPLPGALKKGA